MKWLLIMTAWELKKEEKFLRRREIRYENVKSGQNTFKLYFLRTASNCSLQWTWLARHISSSVCQELFVIACSTVTGQDNQIYTCSNWWYADCKYFNLYFAITANWVRLKQVLSFWPMKAVPCLFDDEVQWSTIVY